MGVYTVHFYPMSMFSYVHPGLTNFTEIATGKAGQFLTVGNAIRVESFEVGDRDDVFDDWAGLYDQRLTANFTVDGVTYLTGQIADIGYGIGVDANGDGTPETTLHLLKINGNPVGFIEQPFGKVNGVPLPTIKTNTTYTVVGGPYTKDISDVPYRDMAICFGSAAMVETDHGPVAAGDIKAGDLVITRDEGAQPVRWVGRRHFDAIDLAATPGLRPVRIRAHALGPGKPEHDLIVSPQHRILVRSAIAKKMFDAQEVLVAAKHLCLLDGIDVADDMDSVTYVHFMFDRHQIVFAEGTEAESLFAGEEALKAVGPAARKEILAIFPELDREDYQAAPARQMPSGRLGRKLVMRHMRNKKTVLG